MECGHYYYTDFDTWAVLYNPYVDIDMVGHVESSRVLDRDAALVQSSFVRLDNLMFVVIKQNQTLAQVNNVLYFADTIICYIYICCILLILLYRVLILVYILLTESSKNFWSIFQRNVDSAAAAVWPLRGSWGAHRDVRLDFIIKYIISTQLAEKSWYWRHNFSADKRQQEEWNVELYPVSLH